MLSQARAEALGLALAAVALITPTVEQRLKELQPGRGRPAASSLPAGTASLLAIADELSESAKQASMLLSEEGLPGALRRPKNGPAVRYVTIWCYKAREE